MFSGQLPCSSREVSMASEAFSSVAVVGAGQMGSALAVALIAAGHAVWVWNRTPQRCEPLRRAGATVATSVEEAVSAAQVTIVCVRDYRSGNVLVKTGAAGKALRGRTLVQLTTGTPNEARALGTWASARGVRYLDGAIMAYPQAIGREDCLIVYAGAAATFNDVRPVLLGLGGSPLHVGDDVGAASTLDASALSFWYASLSGFLHGAAICKSQGWPLEAYVSMTAAALPQVAHAMNTCGEKFTSGRFESQGLATLHTEAAALSQIIRTSRESRVDPGLPKHLLRYFDTAIAAGHGDDYVARLLEVFLASKP
jgi:3-hydroxyisobutyrate dehydrogenase-like beta-hydroxyacid dehydrogenase